MLKEDSLIASCKYIQLITELVTTATLDICLSHLDVNKEKLLYINQNEIERLIPKLEECSATSSSKTTTELIQLKSDLLRSLESRKQHSLTEIVPNGKEIIIKAIVKDKLWKTMDETNISSMRNLFSQSYHALFTEIMLAWVVEKNPKKESLKSLLKKFIIPCNLGRGYIEVTNRKLVALGYDEIIPSSSLTKWTYWPHHLTQMSFINHYNAYINASHFEAGCFVSCRLGCSNQQIGVTFNENTFPKAQLHERYSQIDIFKCYQQHNFNGMFSGSQFLFYGISGTNTHIPIQTDLEEAYKQMSSYPSGTYGFVPFKLEDI